MTWLIVMEYLCHKWSQICSLVVSTSRSFPHSRLITGFVTRITRRVPLVEQELLTLPEHLSSPPVFSGISCYSIFSFMSMFCRSLFVLLYSFFWPLCCLFFDIRILITPWTSSSGISYQLYTPYAGAAGKFPMAKLKSYVVKFRS
jgi:hypothetical protein